MKSTKPEAELDEIPEWECLEILDHHSLGRIGVVVNGRPLIFPVNYAMSGRIVVFRTGAGTILAHAPEARVAFEVDGYDESAGAGWSVMVQGIARDATDSFDDVSWAARAAAPWPLAPGAKTIPARDRARSDHRPPVPDPSMITSKAVAAKAFSQ